MNNNQYAPAGNVIANSERNITRNIYDHRNLAQHIGTDNGLHKYTYNPKGLRIGKQYSPTSEDNWTVNTRYIYGAYGELIAQFYGATVDYWNINGQFPDERVWRLSKKEISCINKINALFSLSLTFQSNSRWFPDKIFTQWVMPHSPTPTASNNWDEATTPPMRMMTKSSPATFGNPDVLGIFDRKAV